jgi:IS30 family transposase
VRAPAPRQPDPARALDREPPAEVGERQAFGHWEADLLLFRKEAGKANVTSLMERTSRFTLLLANEDKRSTSVVAGIADALRGLPEDARRTITFDRGGEFAGYAVLDRDLAVKAYFCDPHSPWQNDRVRRQACFQAVLARSMALSVTTSLRMQAVSASLAGFPARRSRL